jgi:hypothetical protein
MISLDKKFDFFSFWERNVSRFGWKGRGACGTAALGWAARWHGRAEAGGVDLLRLPRELRIFFSSTFDWFIWWKWKAEFLF